MLAPQKLGRCPGRYGCFRDGRYQFSCPVNHTLCHAGMQIQAVLSSLWWNTLKNEQKVSKLSCLSTTGLHLIKCVVRWGIWFKTLMNDSSFGTSICKYFHSSHKPKAWSRLKVTKQSAAFALNRILKHSKLASPWNEMEQLSLELKLDVMETFGLPLTKAAVLPLCSSASSLSHNN